MDHNHKLTLRYVMELTGSLLLFGLVQYFSSKIAHSPSFGFWRPLAICSPLVPFLLMIFIVGRHFWQVDEYLRLKILENWAMTAALTGGWTFAYGYLENLGWPRLSMFVIWPTMGFISAFVFAARRILGR